MGKCVKCGKKILYNNFTVVDGKIYHRECAPVDPEVVKAEQEAKEQFETTMTNHGNAAFVSVALEKVVQSSGLDFSKMIEPPKKKPRKKRSKKTSKKE